MFRRRQPGLTHIIGAKKYRRKPLYYRIIKVEEANGATRGTE
jgi:hypothetical protein